MAGKRSYKDMVDQMNMKTYGTTSPGILPVSGFEESVRNLKETGKIFTTSTPRGGGMDWAKLCAEALTKDGSLSSGVFRKEYLTDPCAYPLSTGATRLDGSITTTSTSSHSEDAMRHLTSVVSEMAISKFIQSDIDVLVAPSEPTSQNPVFGSW